MMKNYSPAATSIRIGRMKKILGSIRQFNLAAMILGGVIFARAQEVTVPDPALNAVIRETLQKPIGPLTVQDLSTLTNLSAISRNIQSIAGLEAARNLASLDLQDNR